MRAILEKALQQLRDGDPSASLLTLSAIPCASREVEKIREELEHGSPDVADHRIDGLITAIDRMGL